MNSLDFAKNLLAWYRVAKRDLPWRKTKDPYKIWISEIMLQQTTVHAVIPYYERWIKQFPNIVEVAAASPQTILKAWQGLGYYSRARNILKSARIIVNTYQGVFPQSSEALRKLPGFGPYTTGAVLSIAFDQREPIIDANVRRVLMRFLKIVTEDRKVVDSKILDFLLSVMPQKDNASFNQGLMELGALICRPKNPSCLECPLRANCQAYRAGVQDIIPKPKKQIIKEVHAAIAVLCRGQEYFIQKRPKGGLFADLWEFPGGKIESGETPRQALVREVKEELGIRVNQLKSLPRVVQYYTQFKANLYVWQCAPVGEPQTPLPCRWVSLKSIHKFPMPSGSAKIVDYLLAKRS